MNSRINSGDGFSVPQKQEFQFMGSWIPATPEKPIQTRSNPIQGERHVNQLGRVNYQEPHGFPNGCTGRVLYNNGGVQDLNPIGQMVNRNGGYYDNTNAGLAGRNGLINRIAGSYTQAWNNHQMENLLARNNAASSVLPVNVNPIGNVGMVNDPLMQNVHSQVDNWREFDLDSLLFSEHIPCSFSSLLGCNGESLRHIPQNGLPASHQLLYDLNSTPRREAYESCSAPNPLPFVHLTTNQGSRTRNSQLSEAFKFSSGDNWVQEKEHLEKRVTTTVNETTQNNCDELLQDIVDSSLVDSTTHKEQQKEGTRENDQGIDLNKTPQEKPPKRKKYMPKVVVEGKSKRKTPKPATPTNAKPKVKTRGTRKQVNETRLKESTTQEPDAIGEMGHPSPEVPTKSCRRALSFDLEKTGDGRHGNKGGQQRTDNQNSVSKIRVAMTGADCGRKDSAGQVGHHNGIPIGDMQSGLPVRNQQDQEPCLPIGNWQSGLPLGNHQNQQPGLPIGDRQSGLPIENQQPGLPTGKQQPRLPTGNQQPGFLIGNQQNQQTGLPIGQQFGVLVGNGKPGLMIGNQQSRLLMRNQQPGTVGSFTSCFNQMLAGCTSLPEKQAAESSSQAPVGNLHMEILKNIVRSVTRETAGICQTSSKTEFSSLQQNIHEGRGCVGFQNRNNGEALDITRKLISPTIHESTPGISSKPLEARGSKRDYHHEMGQMHNFTTDTSVRLSSFRQISQMQEFQRNSSHRDEAFLEAHKKMKIQNGFHSNLNDMPREVIEIDDGPHEAVPKGLNNANANEFPSKRNSYPVQGSAYNENCIIVPPTPPRKAPAMGKQLVVSLANASGMKMPEPTRPNSGSSRRKLKEKQNKTIQRSGKTRGPSAELFYPDSVDEILHRLQNLNLGDKTNDQSEQNALVLYRGESAVVPYEIKKRRSRPKVDLDQETTRIWNLLMGKGGNEDYQEMDTKTEKWWEEERRVFRGRADSFISRMHLVQGDRRFSPWKGSVVDSVIGVFLTQNVTDHLSSSAFMSLAARFPPKSNYKGTHDRNTKSALMEEPKTCVLNLNDIPAWQEKVFHHPPDRQGSGIGNVSKENQRGSSNSVIERISFVETYSQILEEDVLSSQDSFDPSVLQSSGGVGSCSGSNSDAEFSAIMCETKTACGSTKLPHIRNATLVDEIYSQRNGRPLQHRGSNNGHVQEITSNSQQKPRTDRTNNCKDSSSFSQPANNNNLQTEITANPTNSYQRQMISQPQVFDIEDFGRDTGGYIYSWLSMASGVDKGNRQSNLHKRVRQAENVARQSTGQQNETTRPQETLALGLYAFSSKNQMCQGNISTPGSHLQYNQLCDPQQNEMNRSFQSQRTFTELLNFAEECATRQSRTVQRIPDAPECKERTSDAEEIINPINDDIRLENKLAELNSSNQDHSTIEYKETNSSSLREKKRKTDDEKKTTTDWDNLRKEVECDRRKERSKDTMDSIDYEAIKRANVSEISEAIKERGMNNMLAERIKEFLDRLVRDHGSIDLEWLRDVSPDKAKNYLLSVRGLGLKSVECVRLLTLHNLAFPVDTNVGRIAVRLGWVPLQPLPESLQLHLLELYPVLESIQKYLWPRLCKLDQRTLYELHYQLITFGKVFCTKSKPNCNACPMRGECRHFASAFASARLALPRPEEKILTSAVVLVAPETSPTTVILPMQLPPPEKNSLREGSNVGNCVPIIEEPATPEQECTEVTESDIEDTYYEDPDEIPTIKLNIEEFTANLQQYVEKNMDLQEADMSKALVALDPTAASIPTPKLKNVSRLRTEHQVYELPDSHPLLERMDKREPDDPSPYLLAIWTPGETANSTQLPERKCKSQEPGKLCNDETCFSCNSVREVNSQTVRGTLLIPCRSAMRGSFPLNGTYFQVNEVFADHDSSLNPIDVPRDWIWNLPRRTVYFGTSVTSIFRGLTTEQIQYCFWRGFVCVRGFEQERRAPRPLMARLHFPASRLKTTKESKN